MQGVGPRFFNHIANTNMGQHIVENPNKNISFVYGNSYSRS